VTQQGQVFGLKRRAADGSAVWAAVNGHRAERSARASWT